MREESELREKPLLKSKGRWYIALALGAAVAGGAFVLNRTQQSQNQATAPAPVTSSTPIATAFVTALGRLEPQGEVINLSAPSASFSIEGARVALLLVQEGKKVLAGDVVAILDNRDRALAALEKAKGDLRVAHANLAKVKAGAQAGEIAAQKATIARLEADLQGQKETLQATIARVEAEQRNAQSDYERYEQLYQDGAISAQSFENRRLSAKTTSERVKETQAALRQKVATLQKQIDEAKATLNKIAEVRPVDVQLVEAEVYNALATVKQAQVDMELAYVKAPISGEILKIHTRPGERISSDGIVELGRTDRMIVVAEVLEEDIGKVSFGQQATIFSENEAFPAELKGTVIEIGRQIGKQDVLDSDPAADVDARVVEVKIGLSPEASQRVSGLTNAKIVARINI
jgi:HlyD family secretion protein